MWRDALLVAGKDLRIEARTRVTTSQVLPFAFLVLILFAFALDADRAGLASVAAGLYWVAVVFAGILAVQRSFALEAGEGRDALALSGMDGPGIFVGKALAVAAQLLFLQVFLTLAMVVLYGVGVDDPLGWVATSLLATVGISAAGTIYGALAMGQRVRDTLVPLLALPVLAPVVLAAARSSEVALGVTTAGGAPWMRLLVAFATIYIAVGYVAFGPLLEEA